MKFGGTSVADAERIKRAARRIVAKREQGHRVVAVLSRARQDHRRADRDGPGGLRAPDPREMDMLLSTGERSLVRAVRDGDQRPRPPRDLAHRLAGRDRHRHVAHQGAHPRRARRPHPRRARPRTRSCSSPASRACRPRATSPRSAAAARTPPPSRSPPPSSAEVCEIYTDVAGVFTADPRIVPDARKLPVVSFEEMLEMAAQRRRRAAAALGRVRAQPRRAHPLPVELRRRRRVPLWSERRRPMEHPLITAVTHSTERGPRHAASACPTRPGVAGRIFDRARRGERQRRHDHPERARLRGRAGRHVVHGPARRPAHARAPRSSRSPTSWASRVATDDRRWARSRSSAPA